MFDGYYLSTKDTTHKKRLGGVSNMVAIKEINPFPADRNIFLSNYANNEALVKFLGSKLELLDFDIIQGPSDADNPIAMMMI